MSCASFCSDHNFLLVSRLKHQIIPRYRHRQLSFGLSGARVFTMALMAVSELVLLTGRAPPSPVLTDTLVVVHDAIHRAPLGRWFWVAEHDPLRPPSRRHTLGCRIQPHLSWVDMHFGVIGAFRPHRS